VPQNKYDKAFRDYLRDIGAKIRALRDEIGLTTEQAAHEANLSPGYWGIVERGVKQPSLQSLFRFAKALKVEVADLVSVGPATPGLITKNRTHQVDDLFDSASPTQIQAMLTCCRAILSLKDSSSGMARVKEGRRGGKS